MTTKKISPFREAVTLYKDFNTAVNNTISPFENQPNKIEAALSIFQSMESLKDNLKPKLNDLQDKIKNKKKKNEVVTLKNRVTMSLNRMNSLSSVTDETKFPSALREQAILILEGFKDGVKKKNEEGELVNAEGEVLKKGEAPVIIHAAPGSYASFKTINHHRNYHLMEIGRLKKLSNNDPDTLKYLEKMEKRTVKMARLFKVASVINWIAVGLTIGLLAGSIAALCIAAPPGGVITLAAASSLLGKIGLVMLAPFVGGCIVSVCKYRLHKNSVKEHEAQNKKENLTIP